MPGCSSCFYKSPKVGTKGPEDSPFMIIGESPGINEVIQKLPFVGPSGVVIHETLDRVGLGSIEPYFTNAISCLPRQKDPENVSAACLRCRPRLLEEIRRHPRKVILTLGATALQTITGDFSLKVTKERGKLFKSDLAQIGIVAAVHPSFLLRGAGNYTQFERDIKYAVDLMREGESARKLPTGTSYMVLDQKKEVHEFINDVLRKLPEDDQITCDIETTGFNYQTDKILCIGVQYAPKKSVVINNYNYQTGQTTNIISDELFQLPNIYNWHNGKFDCRFLRFKGCSSAIVNDDTMLLSYALNERRGIHDLDQAASDWLGSVNHKHKVDQYYKGFVIDQFTGLKRRRNLSDAPPELLWEYTALDINDTYHLRDILKDQVLQDSNLRKFYYRHLLPGSEYLLRLEMNGMLIDQEWVVANHHRLIGEIEEARQELVEIANEYGIDDINPNSPKQVKDLLYGKMKLAPMTWGTDKDTVKKLIEQHPKNKGLKALKKHRLVAKSHGTYIKPLLYGENRLLIKAKKESVVYPDNRVHSNYLLHGTPTSRLASRDDNRQNIPRDPRLRGQAKAREGYGILECDYSQAELRSLAALSKCDALLEIFLTGKDLHNELTTYLFGEGWTREDKMKAKTVNFGIPYGREAPSMAEAFDVSVDEAQSWIDGWAKRFPGAWKFIQTCRMAPIRGETITTCFGNKKRPGVVAREKVHDLQNESANFPHQSIASNLTIRAGIELIDTLEHDYDTYIVNTVHDCIVMEVPLNLPHILKVAKLVQSVMEEIPTRYNALKIVPFKSSAEFGHRWGNLVDLKQIENQSTCYLHSIPQYIPAH